MKRPSFTRSASLLVIVGLIAALFQCALRIPLYAIAGADAVAFFSLGDVVALCAAVAASSGASAAVSRLVARAQAKGDVALACRIPVICLLPAALTGALLCGLFILCAPILSASMLIAGGSNALIAAASLLFVSPLLGVFRGYFLGRRSEGSVAFPMLLSAVIQVALGLILAAMMIQTSEEMAALGAMIGVAGGELLALVASVALFTLGRSTRISRNHKESATMSPGKVRAAFLKKSVSLLLANAVVPLCVLVDALLVISRMQAMGYASQEARFAFGLLVDMVLPICMLIAALAAAFPLTFLPSIAAHASRKELAHARTSAGTGAKLVLLIGLPLSVSLGVLAQPLLSLLLGKTISVEHLSAAAQLLQTASAGVAFLALAQFSGGVLSAMRLERLPAANTVVALLVKLAATAALLGVPTVNITGASIGTALAYAVLALLNTAHMTRRLGIHLHLFDCAVKPTIATGAMGMALYFLYYGFIAGMYGPALDIPLSILASLIVYLAGIVLLRAIAKEDFNFLPGGQKALRAFEREGVYR